MKGVVTRWMGKKECGFMHGEDDMEYFLHESDVMNSSHIKVGNIMRFEVANEGKGKLRAVNVVKIGHGPAHPFIRDLERIRESVEKDTSEEGKYRLRDIQMLVNYFKEVEDVEWCGDVRKTFRPPME